MKKGFTLVELIGTLIVLSIIALIVTPNILVSIREYKKQVYDSNVKGIEAAAKNWAADNIAQLPTDETESLLISMEELVNGPYLDEKVKDPLEGGYFDDEDHFTFVIVNCNLIKDEITGELINTKYEYNVYVSVDDYIEKSAIKYATDNDITTSTEIEYTDLLEYIREPIKNTLWYSEEYEEDNLNLDLNEISEIMISYDDSEYSAVVNWE